MAARSIASLSISFGLVSIPVKLYSATESSTAIRFKLMASGGARVRQQYVAETPPPAPDRDQPERDEAEAVQAGSAATAAPPRSPVTSLPSPRREADPIGTEEPSGSPSPYRSPAPIERSAMVKGYEFEPGRFVVFTPAELKSLAESSRQTIDIVSFVRERSIDPIYFDKAYFLAPDKRGAKPYTLLLRAMQDSGRCALAKWAFRAKEYVVQIRAARGGMVLQQLLYAEEVRSIDDLRIEQAMVGEAELQLARQLIEQTSEAAYDPRRFVDEEKQRILAAVEQKIAGKQIVAPGQPRAPSGEVVDLVEALRASLRSAPAPTSGPAAPRASSSERKPVKRAAVKPKEALTPLPKARSGKR